MAENDKRPTIRSVYDPSGKEKEVLEMVYERYRMMKEAPKRKDAEKRWDDAMKQWEAYRPEKGADDWQSNHYVPITTAIVETALAEMEDQNSRPLILPRSTEDAPRAMVMRKIYDYTWEIADGDEAASDVRKETLILGTAVAQEYYRREPRKIKSASIDEKGKPKETEEEVLDYDDCMMELVRLQDFFADENARDFDGPYAARDCIRRYIMHMDNFKAYFTGDNDPLKNAQYVKPGGDINYYEFYHPPHGINQSEDVEVLWYWSKLPEDFLIIIANDVVIRFGPNPYQHKQLPFARSIDVKRVHDFYGKGEPDLLESIQDEANTLRRMVLDRNHLDIDKMFFVSDTLNLNDEDLIARPHGAIPVQGDINSAKPIEYGDIPRSVEMSINNLNEDAITVTGVDPRAASKPQPTTATEAALLKEAALKKIRMKLKLFERRFLVRIARLRVANIVQFYSQPRLEKIVGTKGTKEYQAQIQQLQAKGDIEVIEGEPYKRIFREIPVEGRRIEINEKGQPAEFSASGTTFFELNPDYFVPVARGGFVIKFAAGPTLPISKPLLQTKTTEMYDRLIQLALGGIGYDPVKLGDMLLKANDFDPSDFKKEEEISPSAAEGFTDERAAQLTELAMQENEMMMGGEEVPPTPYSSPVHTQIHVEFMNSPDFQEAPIESNILTIFSTHVIGELMAQSSRGQGQMPGQEALAGGGTIPSFQGQGTQAKPPQVGGNVNNPLKQMVPGLAQGGADALRAL